MAPDIIIISGDIVRGSANPSAVQSTIEIDEQYKEADDFLNNLANNFLDGNKERLVIIPGNHDIDWKYSKESMEKLEQSEVFDTANKFNWEIVKDSFKSQSTTRWSWKDLSFFKVTNIATYDKRLEAFSNFYNKFYDGKRSYSITPNEQYNLFDYPEFNLAIVAYNSCYNNDHLRFVGEIHPDCISKSTMEIRELIKRGRLILATWHHNTKGGPFESNYMDGSVLQNFIDAKISIGFHGHQHKMEVLNQYNDIIEQKKIIVFSAGTLCGGPGELPTGINRQYNIIELDSKKNDGTIKVTLHVREKSESSSFNNPVWIPGRIASKNSSFHSFNIDDPRKIDFPTQMLDIDKLINNGEYENAKSLLLKMDFQNEAVRLFLIQCISVTNDFNLALEKFSKPKSIKEAMIVLHAAIVLKRKVAVENILTSLSVSIKNDPSVQYLIKQAKITI